jgi:hypothetical protein
MSVSGSGSASNKYLAQFCGNVPFKMEIQRIVEVTKIGLDEREKNLNRLCQLQFQSIVMTMMVRIVRLWVGRRKIAFLHFFNDFQYFGKKNLVTLRI